MDYLFGVRCKDFVLMAADKSVFQSIYVLKSDADKSFQLGERILMLCVGEGGDAEQFAEYIERNVQLYKMRNGYELSPRAAACYTRKSIADSLRTSTPSLVHLILGGFDQHAGPYLTYMDYLGTQFEYPYLMHGYGSNFCYSILDRTYRENFDEKQATEVLKMCIREIKMRFLINLPAFKVWIVDKDGVRTLTELTV